MIYINKAKLAAEKIIQEIIQEEGKITFPIDPFKMLKRKNIIITFSDFDKLEGLLLFDNQKESLVSINLNRPVTRQRFTAAHELGHIMLHSEIKNKNFLCPIYGTKSFIEREADEFASYLLMPNDELNKIVDQYQNEEGKVDLDQCLLIAEYFGVSFESCVKTISFRLHRFVQDLDNVELNKIIRRYKPALKRKELFLKINDLELLMNSINYSYFSIVNVNDIVGIRFIQNLVYHDNRLENINFNIDEINEIYADFRIKKNKSKYCNEKNQNIIEVLGNIEMNTYCLETDDEINVFKVKKLNKLLYKYAPYPEYAGHFRTEDNLILEGKRQPIAVKEMFDEITKLDETITKLINNIDKFNISDYISAVADIHYKLTVIHPFNDGNGRIARAFMNWLLRLKGLCPIYIDSKNRDDYLKALNQIDVKRDNTQLQIIIVKAIIRTMAELHDSWK